MAISMRKDEGEFSAGKKITDNLDKIFLRIRDAYLYLLESFFEIKEDIPDFTIHFVTKATIEYYSEIYATTVYSVQKDANIINNITYDGKGKLLQGCICSFYGTNTDLIAVFDMDYQPKSILYNLARHFFVEYMSMIQRYERFEMVNISYEDNMYISYAVTEYILYQFYTDVDFINSLSIETYEGSFAKSRIYLSERGSDRSKKDSDMFFSFDEPIQFYQENTRQIRKLLEITNNELSLVVGTIIEKSKLTHMPSRSDAYYLIHKPSKNKRYIKGLSMEPAKKYECEIRFHGYLSWELIYNKTIIKYKNGRYLFAYDRISNEQKSKKNLHELFSVTYPNVQIDSILSIICEAKKQKHGTILLITNTETAISETKRLKSYNRALGISATNLFDNNNSIQALTSIDGAVIIDLNGMCYSIGVIVDGDASAIGNTARASRYNSTVNYILRRSKEKQFIFGIVISEDGTTDIITPKGDIVKI